MNKRVFFSVVIPTYNRAHLILPTINSFLQQSYQDFELIIVDDGGSDNTNEVIAALNDKRLRYYKKDNGERGAARNFGANQAQGDYINFFDSDDLAYNNHLEEALRAVQQLDKPKVFHLGMEMRDKSGALVFQVKNSKRDQVFIASYVTPNAVFVSREAFQEVKYNEDRALSGTEDWLFHLQLAARNDFMPFDSLITSSMLQHDERSMTTNSGENVLNRARLLQKYLTDDKVFMARFSKKLNIINAEMFSLTALYMALDGKSVNAIKYFIKAALLHAPKLATRRFLAVIKIIILNNKRIIAE